MSRRKAIAKLAGALAGSPLLQSDLAAQTDPRPFNDHKRLPGLNEMMVSFDFEPVCFANVSQVTYDYTAHGDGSEFTVRRNRQAFDWVDLVPGKPIDPEDRRSFDRDPRHEDELSDHGRAVGSAGAAAS